MFGSLKCTIFLFLFFVIYYRIVIYILSPLKRMKKSVIFIVLLVSVLFVVILLQDKYGCGKEDRDQCLLKLVEEGNMDQDICNEISSPESKNVCYFTLAQKNENGTELCSRIQPGEGFSRDYCYYSLALSKKSLSLCQEVSSEKQKQLCTHSLALSGIS